MKSNGAILLVEDDSTDVLLMERMFAKVQIAQQLFVVMNGMEAIDFLTKADGSHHPDKNPLPQLILLDLKLPLKSGLEVLKWIRGQPVLKRIPVLIFTSSLDRSDVNGAYDLGANGYFLKTGSLEKMCQLVGLWRDHWLVHNQNPDLVK
jgi:CheY-like chemotaxis protein